VISHGPGAPRAMAARRIRDLLRADLLRGGFPGGRLPSEAELMRSYHSSRGTIRDALDLLRAEGLVRRLTGTGTLVAAHPNQSSMPEIHGLEAPRESMAGAHYRILDRYELPMPAFVASVLEQPVGSRCLAIEYLALQENEPFAIIINYLGWPEAAAVIDEPLDADYFTVLRRSGLTIGSTDMIFDARAADATTSRLLEIAEGSPLLGFEQIISDETGRPYDYAVGYGPGDRLRLLSRAVAGLPVG
jgi:GntR family transcriptional regulator